MSRIYAQSYYDRSGGTQYRSETHQTWMGRVTLSARWNDPERWGELAVYTKYGNRAVRWDSTGGMFYAMLLGTEEFVLGTLFGGAHVGQNVDCAATRDVLGQMVVRAMLAEEEHAHCIADLAGCEDETALWCWSQRWQIGDIDKGFAWSVGPLRGMYAQNVMPLIRLLGEMLKDEWETYQKAQAQRAEAAEGSAQ